jgi:MFS family permease
MKQYITLLKEESVLRRLSLIQLISYFGAWFSNVAIYTLLLEMHASAGVIAMVAALYFIPGAIQAPLSGALIDRLSPKKLMLSLLLVEILATVLLLHVNGLSDLWFLYILIFIRMAAASFYFTAEMSLLPKILDHSVLRLANEIHSIIWSFSYTVGMALSGLVVYVVGVKAAFVLDASLFVICAILFMQLPLHVSVERAQESLFKMMQKSFGYLREHKEIIHFILLHSLVALTSYDAIVALMVDEYYSKTVATALALGLVHAARAVGLVIGPVILGKWVNDKRLIYLFILQGMALLVWSFTIQNFYLSLLASVFVGIATTTLWSYSYTLIQHKTDKNFYGRIVAYNDMIFLLMASGTAYLTGELAKAGYSLDQIIKLLAFAFLLSSLYYGWIYKKFLVKNKDI